MLLRHIPYQESTKMQIMKVQERIILGMELVNVGGVMVLNTKETGHRTSDMEMVYLKLLEKIV